MVFLLWKNIGKLCVENEISTTQKALEIILGEVIRYLLCSSFIKYLPDARYFPKYFTYIILFFIKTIK